MKIGNWPASSELNKIYSDARELGLETNIAELEAFGFTIVEPRVIKAADLFQRMLESVTTLCQEDDRQDKPVARLVGTKSSDNTRVLYGLMTRDPLFAEAAMHPVALTLGRYLMGASCRLFTTSAFVKRGSAEATRLHTDSAGTPPPLYPFGLTCNVSWILTDYRQETGTFAMVPGSHRYARHPSKIEQPKLLGGLNDDIIVPVEAAPGSLIVFNGNTWHGTYPKTDASFRAHVVTAYCRNYMLPAEKFDNVSPELVKRYGPELEHLMARNTWQGYTTEGPRGTGLADIWRANFSPSA